jgi:uroporphyrinogen-III synthase
MTYRVLITRSEHRAAPLIAKLNEIGISALALPVTETDYLVNKIALPDLKEFNWIVFTSANGVAAFIMGMKKCNYLLPDKIRLAAVGPETARVLTKELRAPDLMPTKFDGDSLAENILQFAPEARKLSILWPCGQDALDNFSSHLVDAGAQVKRWICYQTIAIPPEKLYRELKRSAPWDVVLFAAPSAVRAFSAAWENKGGYIAFAIGPTTARSLAEAGFSTIVTSNSPEITECAKSIAALLRERNVEWK